MAGDKVKKEMDVQTALDKAKQLVNRFGPKYINISELNPASFIKYSESVAYLVQQLGDYERNRMPWLKEWAQTWRKMHEEFADIYAKDPMIMYQPKHEVAEQFHRSKAYVRYFRGGNRTSKTTSGYAEHYYILTGQHKWRRFLDPPHTTVLVSGLEFTEYLPKIFLKKTLEGEPGNIISPMFPDGGKWMYHWDPRKYTLKLRCPECANKPKRNYDCPGHHPKSTMHVVSPEKGVGVLEGFSATLIHGDEHLPDGFYNAMQMRVGDRPDGCMIFTSTPLQGLGGWEEEILVRMNDHPTDNIRTNGFGEKTKIVELFQISKIDAGIVSKDTIEAEAKTMDEFEIMARHLGLPAPLADFPVFNRKKLGDMIKTAKMPLFRGDLLKSSDTTEYRDLTSVNDLTLAVDPNGMCRIWEMPDKDAMYVMGVDSASGLHNRDPACATILKVENMPSGMFKYTVVAQYHGWINPLDYAAKCILFGVLFNYCPMIIELTGGLGRAVMLKVKELGYYNIFADDSKPEQMDSGSQTNKLGVDTSPTSKPAMIAAMQQAIDRDLLVVYCKDTITELQAYEQVRTESGLTTRYRGAQGSHDDRVMSLAIAVYIVTAFPLLAASQQSIIKPAPKYDADPIFGNIRTRVDEEIKELAELNGADDDDNWYY